MKVSAAWQYQGKKSFAPASVCSPLVLMRFSITAFLLGALGCASLHAEPLIIPVAGRGWQITLDGPLPAMESLQPDAQGLTYRSHAGRFNLAVFVTAPAGNGGDAKACRDHVWSQARENAQIQPDSMQQWSAPKAECVEYQIAADKKRGKPVQANLDCCFAHEGRWVNVQASFTAATDEDRTLLKNLAQSLAYGPFPTAQGGPRSFVLGALGRLQIDVPAAWHVGHPCVIKNTGLPEQHTLSFFSASAPNKTWKMTFFKSSARYKTLENIQQTATSMKPPAADGSVGQPVNWQEIKLKQGVGCLALDSDAALAGKPIEIGNPKVFATAFVAPVPEVLGTITLSADDMKDPDLLAAIQALSTIAWESVKTQ